MVVVHCERILPQVARSRNCRFTPDDPLAKPVEPRNPSRQSQQFVVYYVAVTMALAKGIAPMDKAVAEELESKHAALHALIEEEEHRSHPDEDLLHRLKKEKLRLKDELAGHVTH
jgi:uncharacterized protein YdcH (DUF465 family)